MTEATVQPKRTGLLIWMIVAQLLAVASLLIWVVMAGMSFMAFDSGGSASAWVFVTAVWCYPIFPFAVSVGAWFAYKRRKNVLAAILSGLSFAPIGCLYLYFWVSNLG